MAYESVKVREIVDHTLTLPAAKAGGFLVHRGLPGVPGLMSAPQAFYFSVCPTAKVEQLTPCSFQLGFRKEIAGQEVNQVCSLAF